jgi:hypothetical protein
MNIVISSDESKQQSSSENHPSQEQPSSIQLQLIIQTLLKELDNIVDKKLRERTMNHESA